MGYTMLSMYRYPYIHIDMYIYIYIYIDTRGWMEEIAYPLGIPNILYFLSRLQGIKVVQSSAIHSGDVLLRRLQSKCHF